MNIELNLKINEISQNFFKHQILHLRSESRQTDSVSYQTSQNYLKSYIRPVPGAGTKIRARYHHVLSKFHFNFP